jgi:hypothetical protein
MISIDVQTDVAHDLLGFSAHFDEAEAGEHVVGYASELIIPGKGKMGVRIFLCYILGLLTSRLGSRNSRHDTKFLFLILLVPYL